MIRDNDDIWFASLQEVRRQVKHIADTTGLGSQHEGQTRLFSRDENDWEVIKDAFDKVKEDGVWQEQQWLNAFECLFWETPAKLQGGSQQDDLIYYVLRKQFQTGETALLVRRKTKSLPPDLCARGQVERISWVDTVLLNLVLQIAFRLTVTISRRQELPGSGKQAATNAVDEGRTVVGEVFASPYRLQVQGSTRQAGRETMVLAYPDICFAVDGSHAGFDQLILRDPGSRLHVQLVAYQGVGLHASIPETQSSAISQAYDCAQPEPVELLSGFVSYEQMGDAMGSSTRTINFLQRQEEAILSLRGPGGQGRALVTSKWVDSSDSGHLLTAQPAVPRPSGSKIPFWGQLKQAALTFTPGERKTVKTAIQCSMLEVNMPVMLSAAIILGVPLQTSADS